MKHLTRNLLLAAVLIAGVGFWGCSDDDNPTTPTDEAVTRPTNLQAYSDEGTVGLAWSPSASEAQTNFAGYQIEVYDNAADTLVKSVEAGPGNGFEIDGLTNGVVYEFRVYARTTLGNLSITASTIRWSPASRNTLDNNNEVIKVYTTTSATFNSAIDIYNDAGKAEVIPQASQIFVDRGDLYVFADSETSTTIEIRGAQLGQTFTGMEALFAQTSTGVISENADNLSEQTDTAPPSNSQYDAAKVTFGNDDVSTGRVYFGRLIRGSEYYAFRMLVRRGTNGKLIQGSGADRYVELEFSYQATPNVSFSKKSK